MRIALGIEYDGSAFSGWQWQDGPRSVQACVEAAVSKVADHPASVICAGRTDTGVHALEQVAHFDTDAKRELRGWLMGINTALPEDVRVLWAKPVDDRFHARYSAIARFYRYVILNRPVRSALERRRVTWVYHPMDEARMQLAAEHLIGEHDFSAYRALGCQSKSPRRRMYFIHVYRREDRVIVDISANAFLHHMVRNIVGVLIAVGIGKQEPEWAKAVLESRDRSQGGVTAPPDGLYFGGVAYPAEFGLARHPVLDRLPADACRYTGDPADSVLHELAGEEVVE
ncbi:tRNA pseudouridine(38-40) synthase TruA [Methylogaea oryzae]|uniref:tRNA pseudouridine(38-40) synthase TruA n=1 Tax=Methylogaea oryzae TaxID=1295382 RepID=UPI0006D1CA35|nr:tRNA pseudouridine(38-40) synthase TruA [Methylogaea oryzae]